MYKRIPKYIFILIFMNVNNNIILLRFYEQNFLWNLKKKHTKFMWDIALHYHALIYGNSLLVFII